MIKTNDDIKISLYPKEGDIEKPQYFEKNEVPLSLYPKEDEIEKPQYFNKTEVPIEK